MGGVTRNWSRLHADVAVFELLQLLTHAGCHGGLHLRHSLAALPDHLHCHLTCTERWMIRECIRKHAIMVTVSQEKATIYMLKKKKKVDYFVRLFLAGGWKRSAHSDWMPFVRGTQWEEGRLVAGCVDKRSIRSGVKKNKNKIPPSP